MVFGTLWPNLMLFDVEDPNEVSIAAPRFLFRIHMDIDLRTAANFNQLKTWLNDKTTDHTKDIRDRLISVSSATDVPEDVILAMRFVKPPGSPQGWPRYELFRDYNAQRGSIYIFRMEMDIRLKGRPQWNRVEAALGDEELDDLKRELKDALNQPTDGRKDIIDAVAFR
jgi:hypothetical protein